MTFPDYPFASRWFDRGHGVRMHYFDEGSGDPIVMLHGNPTWSFYYRRLILGLRNRYRCIAPDHIGMGLSDKPDDSRYAYTLQSRVDDLTALLEHLGVRERVTLALHDWGGMIGFSWALRHAQAVRRLILFNTAAFPLPAGKRLPWSLRVGRDSAFGALAIRAGNAFAGIAARVAVARPLSSDVRQAYLAPYDSWRNRIATLRFVQDIPLGPGDRAWPLVEEVGRRLHEFADRPVFLGWGLQDFVFDSDYLAVFRERFPKAEVHAFPDAGHYVLEDKSDELTGAIRRFLTASD